MKTQSKTCIIDCSPLKNNVDMRQAPKDIIKMNEYSDIFSINCFTSIYFNRIYCFIRNWFSGNGINYNSIYFFI